MSCQLSTTIDVGERNRDAALTRHRVQPGGGVGRRMAGWRSGAAGSAGAGALLRVWGGGNDPTVGRKCNKPYTVFKGEQTHRLCSAEWRLQRGGGAERAQRTCGVAPGAGALGRVCVGGVWAPLGGEGRPQLLKQVGHEDGHCCSHLALD